MTGADSEPPPHDDAKSHSHRRRVILSVAGAVAAVFLGSLLDPVFSPATSRVRDAVIHLYESLPYVPKPASEAERHAACLSGKETARWGPARTFYHWDSPAGPILTMNSIADNPRWGFEGTFIKVRHLKAPKLCLRVAGDVGDRLGFVVYVENSSDSGRNLFTHRLRLRVRKGTFRGRAIMRAYLRSDNSTPRVIWSDAAVEGITAGEISPLPRSTRIFSNFYRGPLPGDIWSPRGALVGPDITNLGRLNGDSADSFYVYFEAIVAPAFSTNSSGR